VKGNWLRAWIRIAVTPDYFRTIGTPLVSGRVFTERDDAEAPEVAIVNESAARHRWGVKIRWANASRSIMGKTGLQWSGLW